MDATMQLATKGQACQNLDQAENYLREFIYTTLQDVGGPMQRHSMEFDLYLPWLQEDVWNAPAPDCEHLRLCDLDSLFMDAAWSLVMKGYLRPGPRKISSTIRSTDYGRGYSLTLAGRDWVLAK